jgi:hypothetical protein
MKTTKAMLALAIAAMLAAAFVEAKTTKSTGIVDRIIEFISGIVSKITGLFGSKTTTTVATTTTTKPPCSPPYILVGRDCCLDGNGNGICDRDEVTTTTSTTTTTSRATTTRATTTTEQTTTTTTLAVKCKTNLDCGTPLDVNICYEKAIYKLTDIPMCRNPGTPESYCYIYRSGTSPYGYTQKIQDCESGCNSKTSPVSCN